MDPNAKLAPAPHWTRPDAYVEALARKRSFRRAHQPRGRSQPEAPQLMLSTLPFLALLAVLAVLNVGIMVAAFPGNQPAPKPKQAQVRELGVAQRGWFQEAQKQFHN